MGKKTETENIIEDFKKLIESINKNKIIGEIQNKEFNNFLDILCEKEWNNIDEIGNMLLSFQALCSKE